MCADLAVKYSQWLGHLTVLLGLAQASHNSDGEWIMDGLGPNIMRVGCGPNKLQVWLSKLKNLELEPLLLKNLLLGIAQPFFVGQARNPQWS